MRQPPNLAWESLFLSYRYTLENLETDMCLGIPGDVSRYLSQRIQKGTYRVCTYHSIIATPKKSIIAILRVLEETLENNKISHLRIRTTDLSKRPTNTHEKALGESLTLQIKSTDKNIKISEN